MVSRQLLIDAVIALAMVLVALIGYKLSPLFLPQADTIAAAASGCDLQRGPCAATLPDGRRIELSVTPRPIPMVRPLTVEVNLTGVAADKVEVDFAGATMNMGYNRRTLTAAAGGRYVGTATLPVCITGAMTWRATVLAQTGRERVAAAFDFDSAPGRP
jgi:hypothetical protein